ncbi:MAG: cyclic nucleotide-binding domain-containing protein [Elusimicrobia bacterium]|nr:cyclic nucleotide-binding domain-containing protein [Elusimicrobiota bacterium]
MEFELDILDIKWAKEFFKKIDFLSQLSSQELTALIYKTRKINFKAGKTILFQGEFSNRLFIVEKGRVGIHISKEGKKEKVAELTENHYFGEISLVKPVPASATVISEMDSDILVIDKENLDELFATNPAVLDVIRKKIEERNNRSQS